MKIEEGQKKQFILLCCLIAFVIGFGVYRILGVGSSAAPPPAPPQTEEEPGQTVALNAETDGNEQGGLEQPIVLAAQPARDPFAPQAVPENPDTHAATTTPKPPPLLPSFNTRPTIGVLPPVSVGSFTLRPGASSPQPSTQEVDPTKDLRLTGVVEGSVNVAIIRGSGNARYIVREGQLLEGMYKVESISRFGVVIGYHGKRFVLRLGGNDAINSGAHA